MLKRLFKYWNKTEGVIMVITPEYEIYFIEIKHLFLFKLLGLLFLDFEGLEDYKFKYSNDWKLINRIVEYKHSTSETTKEMLKEIVKSIYNEN